MDVKLLSDDGHVLRLEAVAGIVRSAPLPDPRPLDDLLGPGGYARNALLSLAEIVLIDTVGMSWLLIAHKRFCQAGGMLVVHSVRPEVMRILELVRFEHVLHVGDDEAAALALLRAGGSAAGSRSGPTGKSHLVNGPDTARGSTRPAKSGPSSARRPGSA